MLILYTMKKTVMSELNDLSIFTIFCFTNLNWPDIQKSNATLHVSGFKKAIAKLDRLYLLQEHYGKKTRLSTYGF